MIKLVIKLNVPYYKWLTKWDLTIKKLEIKIKLKKYSHLVHNKRKWLLFMKIKTINPKKHYVSLKELLISFYHIATFI
jgi:late competence protein required for DNA uptake (superfamily II DNA/RNA helicase)